jgi:hypothetical protein
MDIFNRSHPLDQSSHEREKAVAYLTNIVAATTSISDTKAYAEKVADTYIVPVAMLYCIGTLASYSMDSVNGRALGDNAYDVHMTRITNTPISSHIKPQEPLTTFPYVNQPHRRTDIAAVIDR